MIPRQASEIGERSMNRQPETPLAPEIPLVSPRAEFLYEAIVEIGRTASLGGSPLGERRIVNILGGTFAGPALRRFGLARPARPFRRNRFRHDDLRRRGGQ